VEGQSGFPPVAQETQVITVCFCYSLKDRVSQLDDDGGGQKAKFQIQKKFQSGNSNQGAFIFGSRISALVSWGGSRAGDSSSLGDLFTVGHQIWLRGAQLPFLAQG